MDRGQRTEDRGQRAENGISAGALIITGIMSVFFFAGWADNLEAVKKTSQDIASVQAEFTQEKHLKILSSPLISKGSFHFQKPKSFRWEYTSPIQSVLLMNGDKIRRYIKTSDRMTEDSGVNLQGMQFVMQEITMWLKGDFDHNQMFTASMKEKSKIILTPKEKSFEKMISRIELSLSDQPGIIQTILIYENETDYTRFTFTNARVNLRIDDAVFQKIQ